jgi:hypothetical protein
VGTKKNLRQCQRRNTTSKISATTEIRNEIKEDGKTVSARATISGTRTHFKLATKESTNCMPSRGSTIRGAWVVQIDIGRWKIVLQNSCKFAASNYLG